MSILSIWIFPCAFSSLLDSRDARSDFGVHKQGQRHAPLASRRDCMWL